MPALARLVLVGWLIALLAACNRGAPAAESTLVPSASASASASAHPSAKRGPGVPPQRKVEPPIDGAPLYERYCTLCHGKDGTGYAADNAPSLVSRTFLESASESFIASGIRLGRPGTAMAAYEKRRGGPLEEPEIRAIARFLRSKGATGARLQHAAPAGNVEKGARVFGTHCASCHGNEKARGVAPMLHNPEFISAATPAFLRYAIVNGRPPTKMPAFEQLLKPGDIDDVVTFLKSKTPGWHPPPPPVDTKALAKLPVVMNPKGGAAAFTLRDARFVPLEQVKQAWDAKKRLVIVDARAASDFVSAHIPGAISNPYFDKAGLDRIANDGTWVVAYCACPHHASGEVVDELRRRGFKNTAILDEGILEWQRRKYPIAGSASQP